LQLRIIVSKAIIGLEVEILSRIDKLVYGCENIGRQNPLAIWVCLWILILSYKEHMILRKVFNVGGKVWDTFADCLFTLTPSKTDSNHSV